MNWEWLAGFYEGEGSTGCHKRGKFLHVTISQNEKYILEKIMKFLGYGNIYLTNNRNCHSLQFGNRNARKFLNEIFPYLKSKYRKNQAKIALKTDKIARERGNKIKEFRNKNRNPKTGRYR